MDYFTFYLEAARKGKKSSKSKRKSKDKEVFDKDVTIKAFPCSECKGYGKIEDENCPVCKGRGEFNSDEDRKMAMEQYKLVSKFDKKEKKIVKK